MTTSTSDSSVRLTEREVVHTIKNQQVAGWITSTQTLSDGQVFYGFFATIEQAQDWARNLIESTTIQAVYHPSHNAG